MPDLSLNSFQWRRVSNGFRLLRSKESASERLFANGGREISYCPFLNADNLYALFARLHNATELLDFVNKFGPLSYSGFDKSPRQPKDLPLEIDLTPLVNADADRHFQIRDQVDQLAWNYDLGGEEVERDLKDAALFRDFLGSIGRPARMRSIFEKKSFILNLRPVPKGTSARPDVGIELRPAPIDFSGALWWQLFHKLSGQAILRACLHCGQWFEVGPGKRKRLDAKFCCDEHRVLFNSLKRSKGK